MLHKFDIKQTDQTVRVFGKLINQESDILTHDVPGDARLNGI